MQAVLPGSFPVTSPLHFFRLRQNELIVRQRPEPRVPGPGRARANRRPAGSRRRRQALPPRGPGPHREVRTCQGHRPLPSTPAPPSPLSPQPVAAARRGGAPGAAHRAFRAGRARPTWAARLTWAPWASGGSGPRDRWVPPTGPPRPFTENQTQPPWKRKLEARRLFVALQVPEVPGADRRPPLPARRPAPPAVRAAGFASYSFPRRLRKNQLTAGAGWTRE